MLFNKAALVVETCEQVFARDEHVVGFVHGGNAPELAGFDAVEFAAVPTEAVEGVDGVHEVVAAVAAVHVAHALHSDSPVSEKVIKQRLIDVAEFTHA